MAPPPTPPHISQRLRVSRFRRAETCLGLSKGAVESSTDRYGSRDVDYDGALSRGGNYYPDKIVVDLRLFSYGII